MRDQLATIERLRDDLAEQALRDPLTGLYNRRYLVDMLDRTVADAARTSTCLTVILLDIGYFKSINDRYGHAVGDTVIVAVADHLTAAVREGDTVARYRGEEFVVVLPGCTREQALARAEMLRERCAEVAVSTDTGTVSVTISAGAATSLEKEKPAELLKVADDALYLAKAYGRNRVVLTGTV